MGFGGSCLGPGGRSASQQRIELAGAVEGGEVVEAADVGIADEDLRHRPPPAGAREHDVALGGVEIDANLGVGRPPSW